MAAHLDTLDQSEQLSKPLVGSILLHVSIGLAFVGSALVSNQAPIKWGDVNGGGMGAVAVSPVAAIKLPSNNGPANPVANPTESTVPEAPAKKKVQVKAKAIEPDAIPIKSRNARKRTMETAASQPNTWRDKQPERPNQVSSTTGQAVSSTLYTMTGGGGVGIGTDSPLGTQFGWYAKLLREAVASHWKTGDIDARISTAPPVAVQFTLLRNGTLAPGSVKVTQSSGNRALDTSAQRAVYDAAPFTQLPQQFAQTQAVIELRFELRR